VPHHLISEPAVATLQTLGDALDLVDVGILLLNRDLRASFINRRLVQMLNIPPDMWAFAPTFRQLLDHAAKTGWFAIDPDELAAFLIEREAAVRGGTVEPMQIHVQDGRRLLFSCCACSDGGRILTYTDISRELQHEAGEAREAGRADMRFQNEMLETQGAYLASLAEDTDESARAVEVARHDLEQKIAEQRELEAQLRQLANIDGLTGALNRARFMASAQALQDQGHNLTVLMIDVDFFKSINDRFGHATGDYALQQLVAILQAELRDNDLLGRLGGEEFAVVLRVRSADEAIAVAERLRSRIADAPLRFGGIDFSMTISIGVAARQASDLRIDELLAHADSAMYQAKAAGRNRVVTIQTADAA
jgi:diguanylate cyclase (GGDEF)-like protein